jgi:LCP family protein required for cell wall assembly
VTWWTVITVSSRATRPTFAGSGHAKGAPPAGRGPKVPPVASSTLPEVVGHARRPPLVRVLRAALGLLLVLAIAVPGAVLLLLPRERVDGLASSGPPVGGGPLHVLVTGSDSRADLTAEERIALTTGSAGGERADTILLLTIDGGRVGMLSFPRDLAVERCDGSVGRINGALPIGGPTCLVETVQRLSGIRAHHHVTVTFGGFRDVVDAVGGVELCLDRPIRDRSAGIDLPAGCQVLDGADALGFVRVRKIDSDFARIARQQQFLRALARELTDPTLLVRPWRLVPTVLGASRAVTVDQRLGPVDLVRIAVGMRVVASGDAVNATVPADGFTSSAGAALLRVRTAEADRLFAGYADGSALRAGR